MFCLIICSGQGGKASETVVIPSNSAPKINDLHWVSTVTQGMRQTRQRKHNLRSGCCFFYVERNLQLCLISRHLSHRACWSEQGHYGNSQQWRLRWSPLQRIPGRIWKPEPAKVKSKRLKSENLAVYTQNLPALLLWQYLGGVAVAVVNTGIVTLV